MIIDSHTFALPRACALKLKELYPDIVNTANLEKNFITIGNNQLPLWDAQKRIAHMDENKINGLLVVDGERRLVGAFNMHDLLRAGVM